MLSVYVSFPPVPNVGNNKNEEEERTEVGGSHMEDLNEKRKGRKNRGGRITRGRLTKTDRNKIVDSPILNSSFE